MGTTTEQFITNFHSLHGTTIGERRKNLNILLLKNASSELDFSSLQPTTPLEEKFKLETLIYFKRVPELIEALKSENSIHIERILKINWFLEEAFINITGEQLTSLIFPYISFRTKVKLLNKLALHLKNHQQADDYFKAIENKYGLYLASKLLPSCSAELILNCVKMNKNKILPRQLLVIIKNNPEVTETILKQLSGHVNVEKEYKNIFLYLAHQNSVLFLKLYHEHKLSFHLGWRKTDKFIQSNKQDVIQNPEKFYTFLHNKQIAKSLNQDFKDLYLNLFPPTLKQFKIVFYNNLNILKNLPLKKRNANLLLNNFQKVYNSKLWDHSELISLELLALMPVNEREDNIKTDNKPNDILEEDWYCYMKTEKSIPYLKKSISLCSDIKARVKLIQLLVETCKINKDKVTLAGMCNYMITRHRNDHISVRLGFLNKLQKSFKLEDLEEQHWTPINELIKIFALNDEEFFHLTDYLRGYIHFRLKNNLPVKEQLSQWIKARYVYEDVIIIQDNPQFEKQCLLILGEIIPDLFKGANLEQYSIGFLKGLINWNNRHPEDEISLYNYSSMIDSIKRLLSENSYMYYAEPILKYLFQNKTVSEQRSELLNLYFTKKDTFGTDYDIINWLVHHDPAIVAVNINVITRRLIKLNYPHRLSPFWNYSRYYTHLEIPQKIIDVCLIAVTEKSDDNYDIMTKNSITGLSYLMTSQEFKQFCVPHYPSSLKINSKSEEAQKIYKFQQNIAHALRNLTPPSSALETILIFCKGDYFRLISGSLYSLSDQINEDKLPPFINILTERTVPLKKHSLHLTFRVLDKQHIHNLLNKFMQNEKNASIRKIIFKSVFNYFLTNSDDYSWELVKVNVNSVDVNDKEAFGVIMQPEKIPAHYFAQYFLLAWDILNKLPDPEGKIESDKAFLLCSVNMNVISLLPQNFCETIIQDCLFKCKDDTITYFQSAVQTFTCRYITHCNILIQLRKRLELIFSVLKNYVITTWQNSDNRPGARLLITNFVEAFCLEFLTTNCLNKDIFSEFFNLWNSFFKPHDAFNDYFYLNFTQIYLEKLTVHEIGQKLAVLCDSLANIYGAYIIEVFSEQLNLFLKYFQHDSDALEEYRFILAESLLGPDSSTNCLILILLLLKGREPSTLKTEKVYKSIIEILEKNSDPVIKLHLHSHFRETNCGA